MDNLATYEQDVIKLFQQILIAEIKQNVEKVMKMMNYSDAFSEKQNSKMQSIMESTMKTLIVRYFEVLSNEEIILWCKVYREMNSPKFKAISEKIQPITLSLIEKATEKMFVVVQEDDNDIQ
jgi:stress response protein SCP2